MQKAVQGALLATGWNRTYFLCNTHLITEFHILLNLNTFGYSDGPELKATAEVKKRTLRHKHVADSFKTTKKEVETCKFLYCSPLLSFHA